MKMIFYPIFYIAVSHITTFWTICPINYNRFYFYGCARRFTEGRCKIISLQICSMKSFAGTWRYKHFRHIGMLMETVLGIWKASRICIVPRLIGVHTRKYWLAPNLPKILFFKIHYLGEQQNKQAAVFCVFVNLILLFHFLKDSHFKRWRIIELLFVDTTSTIYILFSSFSCTCQPCPSHQNFIW